MKLHVFALLCSIFFFGTSSIKAQPTAFSLISRSAAEGEIEFMTSGMKYEKALEVYNKLVAAKGDRRFPIPVFKMSPAERHVAFIEADYMSIGLEERAFDICMAMGEEKGTNALAVLLGHELTHFYEKHNWRKDVLRNYSDPALDEVVTETVTILQNAPAGPAMAQILPGRVDSAMLKLIKYSNESQSDYLGGFLAYSAGYDVFGTLPDFFDKVYSAYGIPDEVFGYADRQGRKDLAVESMKQLEEFVDVFEVANMLIAIQRYEDARALYRYILQQYQGREIYNNLGVLTVLEALTYFAEAEKKYRLPVELDLQFGSATKDGFGSDTERARKALLREAITYFDNAIGMDPTYAPAYLNKACAHFLLGETERANFYAGVEAQTHGTGTYAKTAIDARVLLALIAEKGGQKAAAVSQLEALAPQSPIAQYNLRVMRNEGIPAARNADGPEDWEIDGVEGKDIKTTYREIRSNYSRDLRLYNNMLQVRVWDANEKLPHSTLFRIKTSGERPDVFFHLTKPAYSGKNWDDFKVGSSRADLVTEYGEPDFSLEMPNGGIMHYTGEKLLVLTDGNQKIKRWVNYVFD